MFMQLPTESEKNYDEICSIICNYICSIIKYYGCMCKPTLLDAHVLENCGMLVYYGPRIEVLVITSTILINMVCYHTNTCIPLIVIYTGGSTFCHIHRIAKSCM